MQNKFINFYTNTGGGTDEVSIKMMGEMNEKKIPFISSEEKDINQKLLSSEHIIFIHSARAHNDIIFNPDNFRLFLGSSPFLKETK